MIFLYVKTHTKTGMKYFGKTEQDPIKYEGSGKVWRKLLSTQGKDHTTEVVFASSSVEEIAEFAANYSEQFDIANNPGYANMIHESGGYIMRGKSNPNYSHGRAIGWKNDKTVQKSNDKIRNAEYHTKNRDMARARMKCRYYASKDNKTKSHEWYLEWKKLSKSDLPSFTEYYETIIEKNGK